MEIAIIQVEECLTDQCHLCTGYYMNDIFLSKIVCKCKCHTTNPGNVQLSSVEDKIEIKANSSSRSQTKKMLEKVGQPESNTNLRVPFALSPEVKENDLQE
jgi:hypothetical protein